MSKKKARRCQCGALLKEYPDQAEIICPACGALNFQGWGFEELFTAYGLDYLPGEEEGDQACLKAIKEYWSWLLWEFDNVKSRDWELTRERKDVLLNEAVDILRLYLRALAKDKHLGMGPLWTGLAKCPCEWNLLQVARDLIGHMWS